MHRLCLHFSTTLACLQSAAKAGEQTQPEMQSPAPIAAPQMSPCPAGFLDTAPAGVPQGSTPATAPRAANPAAFLRNTNSIFSPDVPAEAGMGRAHVSHDPARLRCRKNTNDMPACCCTPEPSCAQSCNGDLLEVHLCRIVTALPAVCDKIVLAAGPASRQPDLQIQAPAMTEGAEGDLDVRFNLGQFSPPATRRLSTG